MSLSAAAAPLCDLVWIVDSAEIEDKSILRLLPKMGKTIDIAGMSEQEAADALRPMRPDGIVAYVDAQIAGASALAEQLGLDYFDRIVAQRLLDKVTQRCALSEAGLPVPRCVAVPPRPSPEDLGALAAGISFPVVLKPRHGAASRETHLVTDVMQLQEIVARLPAGESGDMIVEEYMAEAPTRPSSYFGDYVSVESVVAHGHVSHLAVTGRLPSAKPFRETGLIIPSDFAPSLISSILRVAEDAVAALDVRTGCLHTEIKVTDGGPRVIEVNGRIGGFVAPVLELACPGVDFFELSLRVALGQDVVFPGLLPADHVGYVTVGQPPVGARRVVSVSGLDRVATYPGVDAVSLNRSPGDEVDWRLGSHEYVYSVLGRAPDHDAVQALQAFVDEEVVVVYE